MNYFIAIILTLGTTALGATVGEFHLNTTDEVENVTEPVTVEPFSEEEEAVITTEAIATETVTEKQIISFQEPVPFFQVLRDFLFQARDGLLDPSLSTEGSVDERTEKIVKLIEHGLVEATTILATQMANSPVLTTPSGIDTFSNRQGDIPVQTKREKEKLNTSSGKIKRQSAHTMVANMSTSCSSCYNNLQKCVQQCFVQHNCNDIQRDARACPPPPSRLCNPFTPWNPVDECKTNDDCKSPLVCCSDGCINKCVAGVWRS